MQNILKSRIKYVNKTFLWMWYVAQAWGQTRLVIISAYNPQEGTEWCNSPGPACSSCCLAPALSWSAAVACHGWWGHLQNVIIALHKTLTGWTDVCPIWLSSSTAGWLRYAEAQEVSEYCQLATCWAGKPGRQTRLFSYGCLKLTVLDLTPLILSPRHSNVRRAVLWVPIAIYPHLSQDSTEQVSMSFLTNTKGPDRGSSRSRFMAI